MTIEALANGDVFEIHVDGQRAIERIPAAALEDLYRSIGAALGNRCPCTHRLVPQRWDDRTGRWQIVNPKPPLPEWTGH